MLIQTPLLRLSALANYFSPKIHMQTLQSTAMSQKQELLYLFGGTEKWNTSALTWKAVDDRVRGGSSQSFLEPFGNDEANKSSARFHGILDTTTLGGAGFASQSTQAVSLDGGEPVERIWDLSSYDGLILGVDSGDAKTYTVTLKDELPDSKRDDGRERSGLSWEADFRISTGQPMESKPQISLATQISESNDSKYAVRIPWSTFRATYRGRDKPDAKPLQTNQIRRFSLMMRSFFEKQDGDFELVVNYIGVY